jgi:hypothetical protein
MAETIIGLRAPGGAMSRAAADLVRSKVSDLIFNHSSRVYAFGALSGARHKIRFDPEILYVSAMFHQLGLTDVSGVSRLRFEIDGANEARTFLEKFGAPRRIAQEVWDAIALHTTPGISAHKTAVIALLRRGVEADLLGSHLEDITEVQKHQVLTAYPRGEKFKERIIESFALAMQKRPETTYGTVNADILDRFDPDFQRKNFCGQILGSDWPD